MADLTFLLPDCDLGIVYDEQGRPATYQLRWAENTPEPAPEPDAPPPPAVPWDRDIRAELDRNPGPYTDPALKRTNGWWPRQLYQIDRLTFHHTLSDSPHATAKHYIGQEGGRPSIPYTIWVTQTGEVLLCVPLEEGLWHDHTGHENTHLSVGLAGSLHLYRPAPVQLDAAARVAAWAIKSSMLPGIQSIDHVSGHMDWITTQCPGWDERKGNEASGYWKPDLFNRIRALIAEG